MIVDGWIDWATRVDGVPDKVYTQLNSGRGIACHSVVGRESEFEDGIPNRFLCTDKLPNGMYTPNCAASSMFVLRESGELIQMYPIWSSTWTSGGREGNCNYWAIEAEGGLVENTREKLTKAAEDTFIRLVTEWELYTGNRAEPDANILQHKQIAWLYGYDPTACASDRYSNAWARVTAGERYQDDMADPRVDKMVQAWGGEAAIDAWNADGNSLIKGYGEEQSEQNSLEATVQALVAEVEKLKVQAGATSEDWDLLANQIRLFETGVRNLARKAREEENGG